MQCRLVCFFHQSSSMRTFVSPTQWLLGTPAIELFRHESLRRTRCKYIVAVLVTALMWYLSWVASFRKVGNPAVVVTLSPVVSCLSGGIIVFVLVALGHKVAKFALQEFIRSGSLKLADKTAELRSSSSHNPIRYTGNLLSTVIDIRHRLEENDEGMLRNVSDFLSSVDGKRFLRDGHKGMKRLCLFQGKLYRKCGIKWFVYLCGVSCCALWAFVWASYAVGDSFYVVQFFIEFLDHLSITYFALLAGMAFSGLTNASMLLIVNSQIPLTEDEKFLISLVSARSVGTVIAKHVPNADNYLVNILECLHADNSYV